MTTFMLIVIYDMAQRKFSKVLTQHSTRQKLLKSKVLGEIYSAMVAEWSKALISQIQVENTVA